MAHGRMCRSLVVALLLTCEWLRANESITEASQPPPQPPPPSLSSSQNLLVMDPGAFAGFLKTGRPAPVSAEDKARVVGSLPKKGDVTDLNASARQKLAGLTRLLQATGRESVYEIRVIDVPQAAIALYARAVVLISESALGVVDADELQALLAHEIAHEYVWTEHEHFSRLANPTRLKDLELVCDGIAIVMLHGLGMDVSRLISGVQKISRFNREQFGTATNERNYPSLAERRAFARAIAAWTVRQTTRTSAPAGQSPGAANVR